MTGRAGAAESRSGPELRTVMLRQEWNVSLNQQESVSNLEEDGGGGGGRVKEQLECPVLRSVI